MMHNSINEVLTDPAALWSVSICRNGRATDSVEDIDVIISYRFDYGDFRFSRRRLDDVGFSKRDAESFISYLLALVAKDSPLGNKFSKFRM
jgi:hypothetical protein